MSGVVADLYANFHANTGPLKTGLDQARGMLKGFDSALTGAGLSGIASFLTAAGAVAGVTKYVKESIKTTAEYSDQIRELTRNTGMSVEQSAKMLMVADDSQVSFQSLTTAMRFSIQNGINPNIEGIAKLSDKYLALQDPLQRSQMLIKQFGRGGLEMSKIMELGSENINKLAESTKKAGLLMSESEVAKVRAYEISINELQDSLKGLSVSFAKGIIPGITNLADGFTKGIEKTSKYSEVYGQLNQLYDMGVIKNQQIAVAMLGWNQIVKDSTKGQELLKDTLSKNNLVLTNEGKIVTANAYAYMQYARARTDAYKANLAIKGTEGEITPTQPADLGGMKPLNISEISQEIKWRSLGGDILNPLIDEIKARAESGQFTDPIANAFLQKADTIQAAMRVSMGEPMKQVAADFGAAWGMSATEATALIRNVGGSVASLNGLTSDIWIFVHTIEVGSGKGVPGSSGRGGAIKGGQADKAVGEKVLGARGLNFTVPAGYPNDSYPMFVESGEKVIVIPRNKVNQIPKFGDGTEGLPMDVNYGNYFSQGKVWHYGGASKALSNKGTEYSPGDITNPGHTELMLSISKMLAETQTMEGSTQGIQSSVTKSVKESINTTIVGLVTAQTAKTSQQISTISGRQQDTAQKNTMISGDMLAELTAIRKGIENIPIAVRDAVTLVAD